MLQGIFGGQPATVDLDALVLNSITVRGALGSPFIWPDVIRLIEAGCIDPAQIITHRVPLEAATDVFPAFDRGETGKVVFTWDDA